MTAAKNKPDRHDKCDSCGGQFKRSLEEARAMPITWIGFCDSCLEKDAHVGFHGRTEH